MRPHYRRKRSHGLFSEINVVPYIDVSLVLLLIFMISAPLIQQGVDIDLPNASAKTIPSTKEEPIIISVDNQAQLYLNYSDKPSAPISPSDLLSRVVALHRVQPELLIMVRGDRQTSYGHVVGVMALLQQAGIERVGLMTDSE